ncbi:DUF1064 domain-containing protein [Exiguobacterium sp. SH5S4]|uniref:DUF1064 domain-containing protein n=1 Tax=Exiguobacterium sp. SH5S4 TaxID=2510961 RepID=UPI00103F91CB|nr:DUF1064 domain-containing protein [Exiguobacterium sp. SH5S4]TCI26751.1 DUF1064 domain-containing protein [Exiguobacterium sp. SH5S4]
MSFAKKKTTTPKASKYKAKKTVVDDIKFDSKIESQYYLLLKQEKERGLIKDFSLQPAYELQSKYEYMGVKRLAIKYVADFLIYHNDGTEVVVDVKGQPTTDAKLKRKLFEYRYPDKHLRWIVWVAKRGGWIDYDDNERMKREENKLKKKMETK